MTYELEIKGKVYQFKFGIGFVKDINPQIKRTEGGVSEDIGLQGRVLQVINGDILGLEKVLMSANKGFSPRLTENILDEYLDDEDTDIDKIVEDVKDFFKTSNATKKVALAMEKAAAM